MSRRRVDREQGVSAIDARYEARRAEIEREYSEFVDVITTFEAAVAGGEASRSAMEREVRRRHPRQRVMTVAEAAARRREWLREALDDYRCELKTFELAARVHEAHDVGAPKARDGERGPFDAKVVRAAIELRLSGASYDTMAAEIDGLSKRQARYIGQAIGHRRLRITRSGIQGFTRREGDWYFIPSVP